MLKLLYAPAMALLVVAFVGFGISSFCSGVRFSRRVRCASLGYLPGYCGSG